MNWYKRYLQAEKVQPKGDDLGWSYIEIPKNIIKLHSAFTKTIDKKDLYIEKAEKKGDWSKGIEDEPHITAKYGFDFDDPSKVIKVLEGVDGGFVKIDSIDIFKQDDYDVLVIRCKSKKLNNVHKKLTDDLNIEDKFPEFTPHITIAYFKKGKANEYKSLAEKHFLNKNLEFEFDKVFFEDSKDKVTKIKLE